MNTEEAKERVKTRFDKWALDNEDLTALQVLGFVDAESEDERIREAIESIIRVYGKTQGGWIAGYDMDTLIVHLREAFDCLEKQKEQPMSAEEVFIRAGLKPYRDGNQWCVLAGGDIQEGICGFGDTIDEALYQFLMEVLKIQKEQQPAEWSAEDEKMRRNLMSLLYNMRGDRITEETFQKYYPWLKILPERFPAQPHWKPSEEQMEALNVAVGDYNAEDTASCEKTADILESLYTDLQKLF